jgi:hypothetical protein
VIAKAFKKIGKRYMIMKDFGKAKIILKRQRKIGGGRRRSYDINKVE